jgi:hypothetical protein
MASTWKVRLEGGDELERNLRSLTSELRTTIAPAAVGAAGQVLADAVRRAARYKTGKLRRGIRFAGTRLLVPSPGRALEHGTGKRYARVGKGKKLAYRGIGPRLPFVGPAIASATPAMVEAATAVVWTGVEKAASP